MNERGPDLQGMLTSVEKITLFLDDTKQDHVTHGLRLLTLEHPDLRLMEGEIDLLIVSSTTNPETGETDYSTGWIGGGTLRHVWAETKAGVIVDPWIDEKIRTPGLRESVEPLPIVMRTRNHGGPLDIVYTKGTPLAAVSDTSLQKAYHAWLKTDRMEEMKPDRMRFVLTYEGVESIHEFSRWAQAVSIVDHHGIPPTRARKIAERETPRAHESASVDLPVSAEKAAIPSTDEKKQAIADAMVKINKPAPLQASKIIAAVLAGSAIASAIIYLFP